LLTIHAKPLVTKFMRELTGAPSAALLLDYDGTLAPFRVERDQAFPYAGVPGLIEDIMRNGSTKVVLITGRRAGEVPPLLGVSPHPEIWGSYGLQQLTPDGKCQMRKLSERAEQALASAEYQAEALGFGNLTERKPGSLAVHWRGLKDSAADYVRERVFSQWLPIAEYSDMCLHDFDGGLEIRVLDANKGNAIRKFLARVNSKMPVAYLGDDLTDEDAFRALKGRGLTVLVRPQWRETTADVWLHPPAELMDFLSQWHVACKAKTTAAH